MTREDNKILGINPGTRYLGIAGLYGQELMDWRIKVLNGKWAEEKIKKAIGIVYDLIERYAPNILAIKKLHPSRRTENLLRMANTIKSFARRRGLRVCQSSVEEIKNRMIKEGKKNKQYFFEVIGKQFPSLHLDLKKEQRQRNLYYFRALEAIALILV